MLLALRCRSWYIDCTVLHAPPIAYTKLSLNHISVLCYVDQSCFTHTWTALTTKPYYQTQCPVDNTTVSLRLIRTLYSNSFSLAVRFATDTGNNTVLLHTNFIKVVITKVSEHKFSDNNKTSKVTTAQDGENKLELWEDDEGRRTPTATKKTRTHKMKMGCECQLYQLAASCYNRHSLGQRESLLLSSIFFRFSSGLTSTAWQKHFHDIVATELKQMLQVQGQANFH